MKQAVACVVKKRKCDGDGYRSDGDARSRTLVGNRSRAMTSNPILHLMATEKDIIPTTTGYINVYNLVNNLYYFTYLVNAMNTITTCIHRHLIIRSHEAEVSIAY